MRTLPYAEFGRSFADAEFAGKSFLSQWPRILQAVTDLSRETPSPRIIMCASPIMGIWMPFAFNAVRLASSKHALILGEVFCSMTAVKYPAREAGALSAASPNNPMWNDTVWYEYPKLLEGASCLLPRAVGPRYASTAFVNFWENLSKTKLVNAGYQKLTQWQDTWLDRTTLVEPYFQMHFEGMTAILAGISNMLHRSVAKSAIIGEDLRKEIMSVKFEGLSGAISFDKHGDLGLSRTFAVRWTAYRV